MFAISQQWQLDTGAETKPKTCSTIKDMWILTFILSD
jgi:hypothetical protein